MVNSLSSQNRANANNYSSSNKNSNPQPADSNVSNVSQGFFQGMRNKITQASHRTIAATANYVSSKYQKEDEQFLFQLTGSNVSSKIKDIAPQLPAVIQKLFPGVVSEFASSQKDSTEKVTEALMIHLIANLAASLYPDEAKSFYSKKDIKKVVTLDELTQQITNRLMLLLAEELDAIDQNINSEADITADRFEPLAKKLMDLMLPQQKTGIFAWGEKKLAGYFLKDLSNSLMKAYKPFGVWFTGGKLKFEGSASQDLIPILEKFVAYTSNCMADYHGNEDRKLLQELTGVEDIQALVGEIAPKMIGTLLGIKNVSKFLKDLTPDAAKIIERNQNTIDNVSSTIVLKIIANIAREVFSEEIAHNKTSQSKQTVSIDEFVIECTRGVSDIFGQYIHQINQIPHPTQEDFQPLAVHLLKIILPHNPIVESFLSRRQDRLTEYLTDILKRSYESIAPRSSAEEYKNRLKNILGNDDLADQLYNVCHNLTDLGRGFIAEKLSDSDVIEELLSNVADKSNLPPNALAGVASGISQLMKMDHQVSDPQVIFSCLSGIDPSLTESLIAEIAILVKRLSKKTVISEPEVLIAQLEDKNHAFKGLDQKVKEEAAKAIISAMYADNPIYWVTPTIQNALQLTLFKALVHLLEKVEPAKRNRKELFPAALQILLDVSAKDLAVITNKIRALSDPTSTDYIDDEEERETCIKECIDPFVDKLIHIFFEDNSGKTLKDHLPFMEELRPYFAGLLRDNAYKLILPMIETSTSWIDAKETNKERLIQVFGNTHAVETCRLAGTLASQAVPYSLQEYHKTIADGVSEQLAFLFTSKSGKQPTKQELNTLKKMIDHTLVSLSENKTPAMNSLLHFVESFSEAALLRLFADLAECLNDLDEEYKDDPDGSLLVQGTTLLLNEVEEHLSLIAELKAEKKQYRAGKISHKDLVQKFKDNNHLHDALESQEQKDQFFIDLTKKFLGIVGVSKVVNLPIPDFLKSSLWDFFEESLMPMLLATLFEQVKDPHTLNLVLISIFEQINETAGNVDVSIPDDEIRKYKDAPQDQLEEISGKLIKALVDLNPTLVTKWALKNNKIRNLAGQAMAQPLRNVLEEKSMVMIIDELLVSLLPTLHPGKWDDKTGKFVCLKVKGKKEVEIKRPNFSHLLPRTAKAKQKREKIIARNCKDAEKLVVKEIAHAIENQTQYIFLGFFRKIWRNFRKFINRTIERIFGKYAPNINKVVNKLLDGFGSYFVKPALYVTAIPVLLVVRRLLRFYFVHQSSRRVEDVNHKINENVVYRLLDELLELVGNAKNSHDLKKSSASDYDSEVEEEEESISISG